MKVAATSPPPSPPFTGRQLVAAVKSALRGEPWSAGMTESQVVWLATVMPESVRFARLMDRFSAGTLEGADLEDLLTQAEW